MAFCSINPGANTGAGTYIAAAAMRPQACRRSLLSAGATSVQRCNFTSGDVSPAISSRCARRRISSPARLMCFDFSPMAVLSFAPGGGFESPHVRIFDCVGGSRSTPERTSPAQERPPGTSSESGLTAGMTALTTAAPCCPCLINYCLIRLEITKLLMTEVENNHSTRSVLFLLNIVFGGLWFCLSLILPCF